MPVMEKAVVLLSGGQDSTTCLAWALSRFHDVKTVSFDYGQRHAIELERARAIADQMWVPNVVLDAGALKQLASAALTNRDIDVHANAMDADKGVLNYHAAAHGLPSTFVPGRNMLFLTLAAAFGAKHGIYNLVTGVCESDAAGYPDCRQQFITDASLALTSALDEPVKIHTPLMHISKADTWLLADELGVKDMIIQDTRTCYEGDESELHAWGYGCGSCPACIERRNGYELAFGAN